MTRLTLCLFTFSNGVTVPAGTLIVVPGGAVHRDGEIYPNSEGFDGFRFAKLREYNGDAVARHQALSMSVDHLTFGYGRHTWRVLVFTPNPLQSLIFSISPGRFFAVNKVKALLVHVVVTYDIKFEEGKQAPRCIHLGSMRIPGKANAMFRKRQRSITVVRISQTTLSEYLFVSITIMAKDCANANALPHAPWSAHIVQAQRGAVFDLGCQPPHDFTF